MAVQPYNYANTLSNVESIRGQRNANALAEQRYSMNEQANALSQQQLSDEQKKQFATVMVQAAQYGLQSNQPKAFIEKNYPQLVQLAGPEWGSLDDNGVKSKLQEAIGHFGPVAGIGPAPIPEEKFSAPQEYLGPDGKPGVYQIGGSGKPRQVEGLSPIPKPTPAGESYDPQSVENTAQMIAN